MNNRTSLWAATATIVIAVGGATDSVAAAEPAQPPGFVTAGATPDEPLPSVPQTAAPDGVPGRGVAGG
jgi:hypothetical protein